MLREKKQIVRIILVILLISFSFGFMVQSLSPSDVFVEQSIIDSQNILSRRIQVSNILLPADYQLNLRVNCNANSSACKVFFISHNDFLLIEGNYSLLENEINGSSDQMGLSSIFRYGKNEYSITKIDFHLVIINLYQIDLTIFYHIGVIPNYYYIGIIISIISLFFLLPLSFFYFSDEKRYFIFPIGLNLLLILFRMSTLGQYNGLNLQYSYDLIFPQVITHELWNDYEFWYSSWIDPLMNGTFIYDIVGYEFPPLFILTLGIFDSIPFFPIWRNAIPIFGSYLASGVVIYYLMKKITLSLKYARVAMLLFYVNPINLAYGAFCWLNPPLFILFSLIAFYFMLRDSPFQIVVKERVIIINEFYLGMFTLALATMYKQFVFIFFVPFIILYSKQKKINRLFYHIIAGTSTFFVTIFIILFPFLLQSPLKTISRTLGSTTQFSVEHTKYLYLNSPVTFNTFFVATGLDHLLPGFTDIIGFLLTCWIPLILSVLIIYYLMINLPFTDRNKSLNHFLLLLNILVITSQVFYPRGVYKFYFMLLIPFFALALSYYFFFLNRSLNQNYHLLIIAYFILIVLLNRFVYFILIYGLVVILIRLVIKTIRTNGHPTISFGEKFSS